MLELFKMIVVDPQMHLLIRWQRIYYKTTEKKNDIILLQYYNLQ